MVAWCGQFIWLVPAETATNRSCCAYAVLQLCFEGSAWEALCRPLISLSFLLFRPLGQNRTAYHAGRGSPCCRSCEALGRPLGQSPDRVLTESLRSPRGGRGSFCPGPERASENQNGVPRSTTSQESIPQHSSTAVTQGYSANTLRARCSCTTQRARSATTD